LRFLLFLIPSLLLCMRTSAQVYPVQATTQLLPPYTPSLADYTTPGAQKLIVQIRLNDPAVTAYMCKLRLTIEGVGITLRTKQSIFLNPITLQGGGIPQVFYGEDLEEYFRSGNLDFSGISRAQYEKNKSLPEGVYRFTIEVLDYNRNIVVSNKATTMAWMVLNDPPLLNLPTRETKIQLINPTNIPFTWTPRHTGSPNAAFSTVYTFRLVEMAPGTPSSLAQNAMQSQPTLYELTTNQTQIVYGMAEPALIPGRKYAWQVQATDTDGRDLFRNQGRSEVYVFQFGNALAVPENMYLQSANASALTLRWEQNITSEQNFRVSYRPHQNRNTEEWYEIKTTEQWKSITQLKPDTEYEVKVRSEQGLLVGEFNPVQIYRTVPLGANEFVCKSDVPPLPIPSAVVPLFGLSINDTIRAGGYNVLVRHVSGSNGTFSGDGVAIVPWFNSSKVRVTFENISVNSQFWLTAGVIKSVWDADSQFLLKIPPADSVSPGSTPNAGNLPVTIAATDSLIRVSGASIAAVTRDETGNIVISTTDGKQQVLEKGKSYSVADDIGNGYVVDKEGNIAKTTAKEAIAAAERGNRKYNLALKFEKGKGAYGFDEQPQDATKDLLANYYQAMEDGKRISWKALADGMPDVVDVVAESADLDPKKISFELNGAPIKSSLTDKIKLDLIGQGDGVTAELLAKYEGSDKIIGKLNVINYKEITRTLVLVPVNDRELEYASLLKTALDTIYKQAAVTWNVVTDRSIKVSLDETFDDTSDEAFSNYTDDMKKVISVYTKDHTLAPDTYYLFLVDKPKSVTKAGQLPRKKQAGFLFVDNLTSQELTIKTVAHELGHGAFRLEHTFKQFPTLTKEMTNNLMDYRPDGTYLYKYQWDYIHDPEAVLSLFEEDEDGSLKNYSEYIINVLRKIRNAYGKGKELTLESPPEQRKSFTGRVTLENGQVYDLTITFQKSEPIKSEIKGFQGVDPEYYTALSDIPQKALTLYNSTYYSQSSTLINIIFDRFGFEDDKEYDLRTKKDLKSLAEYLFWKPVEGNNLTVFVSGFDLKKHSDMLNCKLTTASNSILKNSNQILWEELKLGYVALNDRPFILDLKETILPKECQNIDSFTSNFTISDSDYDNYWTGIDLQFMYATGNSGAIYAQGDNSIRTAMNKGGFERRVSDGRRAAEDLIHQIKRGAVKLLNGSKIDVVCHSMGFAYALGMIDGLQHGGYKIGWVYSVAPENPGAGKVPEKIEGMWQYGSQETDPFYSQDGIAPQVAIPGIVKISIGGRVPIPPSVKQDFFNSHSIGNYKWIFNLKKEDLGYVKPRK
jgi:TANFOR domain-containing protein